MIAIIAALERELTKYRQLLTGEEIDNLCGLAVYKGTLVGKKVVLLQCGVGKVNAAFATAAVIAAYDADYIINTGVAGGIGLHPLDVVIAKDGVQHDVDFTAIGDPVGYVDGIGVFVPSSEKLQKLFCETLPDAQLGTIASGDLFVADKSITDRLKNEFGAIAVDCESAAILQVAFRAKKQAIALRVMSDCADEEAPVSFDKTCEIAASIAADAVIKVIEIL